MSSIYGESRYLPISILISTQCVDIGNHQLKSNLCSITPSLLILIKVRTRPRDKEGKGFIGMVNLWKRSIFSMPQSTKSINWKAPIPHHPTSWVGIAALTECLPACCRWSSSWSYLHLKSEYQSYHTWDMTHNTRRLETETRGHWHNNWPAARNHSQLCLATWHVTPGVATSIPPSIPSQSSPALHQGTLCLGLD